MDLPNALGVIADVGLGASARINDKLTGQELAYQRNLASQSNEMAYNAEQAQIQRDHELYMSNTAYQRAVADMKKAGINPASLSGVVSGSGGASSSSSSAASGSSLRTVAGNKNYLIDSFMNVAKMSFNAGSSVIGALLKS